MEPALREWMWKGGCWVFPATRLKLVEVYPTAQAAKGVQVCYALTVSKHPTCHSVDSMRQHARVPSHKRFYLSCFSSPSSKAITAADSKSSSGAVRTYVPIFSVLGAFPKKWHSEKLESTERLKRLHSDF
jgi:hypothetical protein